HPAPPVSCTLSLHDALPICVAAADFTTEQLNQILAEPDLGGLGYVFLVSPTGVILSHPDPALVGKSLPDLFEGVSLDVEQAMQQDRKSTRLNSSHVKISYAV